MPSSRWWDEANASRGPFKDEACDVLEREESLADTNPCGQPGAYCHCDQNCPQGFVWTDEWPDGADEADRIEVRHECTGASLLWGCDPVLLGFTLVFLAAFALSGLLGLLGVLL